MKFAKIVFLIAGVYGLLVLTPLYFLEDKIGRAAPRPRSLIRSFSTDLWVWDWPGRYCFWCSQVIPCDTAR